MLAVAWGVGAPVVALAGGGPENVVLVVNANSASSKLIANHYIHGRNIPTRNVIYINGDWDRDVIELDDFRDTILKPVFEQIEERKIAGSVDYIVYSADFPTTILIKKHLDQLTELMKENNLDLQPNLFLPQASINALTFFAGAVLGDQPGYLLLDANTYYRQPADKILRRPFVGERQKEFEAAIGAIDEPAAEFESARRKLEEMAKLNPRQIAVLYWLARFYAKSGDAPNATRWLVQAIRMGWAFRKQTESDLAFGRVKDDPLFKGIVSKIPDEPFEFTPTQGFKQNYQWGVNGIVNHELGQGNRYFLSTVLAVTRDYSTNEREALRQLQLTMKADATYPEGTFYFSETSNVRSTTRQPNFKYAIEALKRLGHSSQIINTTLPVKERDVLGLTTGTPSFSWTASGSKIVPGAICENLTSYGGVLRNNSQTKLTEFLRHDAAGSSGTVTEPYAIQAKFPHPMIHAHYAAGCSLAEAFYQSVAGPYQLLIVGDPLCQPWATPPLLLVSGVAEGDTLKGTTTFEFDESTSPTPIAGMELYVDGVLVLRDQLNEKIAFDTSDISDGYHELRFVTIANSPIETTGRVVVPIRVDNHGFSTTLTSPRKEYLDSDTIRITAKSNHGDSIELTHNMRSIAKKIGREVEFELPAYLLGRGPVRLEAISINEDGQVVASEPMELIIEGRLSEYNEFTEQKKK